MSLSLALRHVRHLSTAATSKPVYTSFNKHLLGKTCDPDEALKIYSTFTATNNPSTSPASICYSQQFIVRCLAKSRRFSDIEKFLESHKSQALITDEFFLSSLIRSYGIAGMFKNALNTYNQMEEFGTPRSSISFNAILSACVQSKAFDSVPVYFTELPAKFGFSPDKISYGFLVRSYCEMGSPEIAIEKLSEIEEKGIEVNAIPFTTILQSLYKKGKKGYAETFWDEMVMKKGLKPNVGSYNVRLKHTVNARPENVKQFIDEMITAGIEPDVITYNHLMTCYCKKGMINEAKNVYDRIIEDKDCNPNPATFRTLVFYMCKNGQFIDAYKVFKLSVKKNKIPDFNTLKFLAEGLAKSGHESEVKTMIKTVHKKFPPNLLKAWGKLAVHLGLNVEEINSDSGENLKAGLDVEEINSDSDENLKYGLNVEEINSDLGENLKAVV